jgi:prophage antirepressor-like protein
MLGYSNTTDAINRHCKGVVKHDTLTKGGTQKTNFIPEGDLYRLIISSKLPSAEKFEKWVFDEVLPTIRRTGMYMTPDNIEELLLNPDTIIALATALKSEQAKNTDLKSQISALEEEMSENKAFTRFVYDLLKKVITKAEDIQNPRPFIDKSNVTQRR